MKIERMTINIESDSNFCLSYLSNGDETEICNTLVSTFMRLIGKKKVVTLNAHS